MTTSIHISALDGIVNVNSLFTFAVFVGLAWNPTDPSSSLVNDPTSPCVAGPAIVENIVSFHVFSFSSFLFSSLIALALKQALRISKTSGFPSNSHHLPELYVRVNKGSFRVGMLASGVGSVVGCVFLMLALINVVQFKLGTLACGSGFSLAAVVPLVIFVSSALLIYSCIVLYAFFC
ncbi:uncharacterized protein LOC110625039 [Manihot esculenta]|uniref:Maternal effect embryo arrest 60 n=1 Tax=Manihot esculenta TaxID=3983 RepID=A0A2C9V2J7_MANES|nr:uncharacterized protein LOC110625039 [Manihot esculenta]OAY38514.1 hypothetical protein MANES_10G021100v8 [Manihot esculenta]